MAKEQGVGVDCKNRKNNRRSRIGLSRPVFYLVLTGLLFSMSSCCGCLYVFECLYCRECNPNWPCPGSCPKNTSIAQAGEDVFITSAAHVAGANDTAWRTDVEILNPGTTPTVFEIAFFRKNQDNSSPATRSFELAGGVARRFPDILETEFGFSGAGSLRITPSEGSVAVNSRTYNQTPDGSYGQFIAGVPVGDAVTEVSEGRLIQLSHTRSSDSGFRTNIGFFNLEASPLTVDVDLFLASGDSVGSRSYELPPNGYTQVDRIFEKLGTPEVEDGFAVVKTTTPGGKFFAYASIVDNRTGDPVYLPAKVLGDSIPGKQPGTSPAGVDAAHDSDSLGAKVVATRFYLIPAAAHVSGAAGTNWRTDLELHNPGDDAMQLTVELLPQGQPNPNPENRQMTLEGGSSLRVDDALQGLFAFSGAAALRIGTSDGEAIVTSRTYNLTSSGTYGQFIGAVTEEAAIEGEGMGLLMQLSQSTNDSEGYRTNIGFFNIADRPVVVDAAYYRNDGALIAAQAYLLAAFESAQLNRAFRSVTSSPVEDGYVVLSTASEGSFVAYASVIDNRTADPVYIPAVLYVQDPAPGVIRGGELLNVVSALLDELGEQGLDLETALGSVEEIGIGWALDIATLADSPILEISRTDDGVRGDFQEFESSGVWTLSVDEIVNSGGHVKLGFSAEIDDVVIGGVDLPFEDLQGEIEYDVDGDGHVEGDVRAQGTGPGTTLTADVHVDTEVCATHPISGTIAVVQDATEATLIYGEPCGAYSLDIPGAPAFSINPTGAIMMTCEGGPDYGDSAFSANFRADGEIDDLPVSLLFDSCLTGPGLAAVRNGGGSGVVSAQSIELTFVVNDDWTLYGGGTWRYEGRFEGEFYDTGYFVPAYLGTLTIRRHGTSEYGLSCEGTYVEEDYQVVACYADHEPYCTFAADCP